MIFFAIFMNFFAKILSLRFFIITFVLHFLGIIYNPTFMTNNQITHFHGIDIMRSMACIMVLVIHACECYYISNFYSSGSIETLNIAQWHDEAIWAGIIGSVCRCCVPLFVMISGFLLLPMNHRMTMGLFYRKRAKRVLIPLFIWTVIYAFYSAFKYGYQLNTLDDYAVYIMSRVCCFFVNFPSEIGHLWYPYMYIGLCLFIPILSPWVERATKNEMHVFLGLWCISLLLPYIHLLWPEVWGECYWNTDGILYHFSGFIGYLVAGAYCRKFLYDNNEKYFGKGLVLAIHGYALTLGGFIYQLNNLKPEEFNYSYYFQNFEVTWMFNNISIGLLTIGVFLMLFKLPIKTLPVIVCDFSRLSYGIYLCHVMFLTWFYETLISGTHLPTPCKILSIAVLTIVSSYLLIKALSYLPKSKLVVGN